MFVCVFVLVVVRVEYCVSYGIWVGWVDVMYFVSFVCVNVIFIVWYFSYFGVVRLDVDVSFGYRF